MCKATDFLTRLAELRRDGHDTKAATKLGTGDRAYAAELVQVMGGNLAASPISAVPARSEGAPAQVRTVQRRLSNGALVTVVMREPGRAPAL